MNRLNSQNLVKKFLGLLCLVCALCLVRVTNAQTLPLDPLVNVGKLDNGIRIYFRPTQTAEIDVRLVVNAGSLDERDDEQGYAHFVEHLAFRKTKQFRDGEIVDFVRSLGGQFGQHLNAFTNFNQTQYWINLPPGKASFLPKAVQVLSDWIGGVEFNDDIVNIEKGVIAAEKRTRDQSTLPTDKVRRTIFDQPLYRREIIGTFDSINQATASRLAAFYRRNYTPDKISIVISGALPDGMGFWRRKINDAVGSIPPTGNEAIKSVAIRPAFNFENRVRVVFVPESTRNSVGLVSLYSHRNGAQRDDLIATLTRRVAVSTLNQRLQTASEKQPWVTGKSAADTNLTPDARLVEISASFSDKEKSIETYTQLLTALEQFLRDGPSPKELETAMRPLLKASRTGDEESVKVSASAIGFNLANHVHNGGYFLSANQFADLAQEELPKITPLAVVKSLALMLEKRDFLLIVQSQRNEAIPANSATLLKKLTQQFSAQALQQVAQTRAGEQRVALQNETTVTLPPPDAPGQIIKEENLPDGAVRLTLSNQAVVYVKPTRTTVDHVIFLGKREFGLWALPETQLPAARIAQSGVWSQSGIGPLSPIQLGQELSARNLSWRVSVGGTETAIRANGRSEDLPFALHLVHEFFTTPIIRGESLGRIIAAIKPTLEGRNLTPEQSFSQQWATARLGKSAYTQALTAAQIEAVNTETIAQLHQRIFSDASQFVFAFAGNVSLRDIRRLCETYLANLPSSNSERLSTHNWAMLGEEKEGVQLELKKSKTDRAQIVMRYVNSDVPASLELQTRAVQMQAILSNRLRLALRQETGLAYSPKTSVQMQSKPKGSFSVTVEVTAAVKDAKTVESAIRGVVKSLAEQPLSAEELAAFRESFLLASRSILGEPIRATETLVDLHFRGHSIQQLQTALGNALKENAPSIQAQFALLLADIEPSVGVLLPEAARKAP